ncbi:MAG: sigma-70 family RNA polymerase sigma factor [Bdellovibrionota bacterium]|jgi:RNA polymerase sigma factor for flagellar operon FliA
MAVCAKKIKQDELILKYQFFVTKTIWDLFSSMNIPRYLFEDCLAAGYLGLVKAARNFNVKKKSSFRTYAFIRIRGSALDYLRHLSPFSRAKYYREKAAIKIRTEEEEALKRLGKEKTPAESRRIEELINFTWRAALAHRLSIVEEFYDIKCSVDNWYEREFECLSEQPKLKTLVSRLPEIQQKIIHAYYYQDKTFSEISTELKISKPWAFRIHNKAIDKLREMYAEK